MQDYAAAFTNFSGAFPDILAVNASGPSATDGTEFVANMINDSMWGVWQMILNHAGLTPNGVLESDSASQMKEAIRKGFALAPGMVAQWHLDDDPGTSGHRALLLNGQGILRANYPDLDAAVYVGDGNNATADAYYRADNSDGSSRNIAGIYLILPETRGYVPRGLDTAASVDPDGASRTLGHLQLDAFQGWQVGATQDSTGARNYFMLATTRDQTTSVAGLANHVKMEANTTSQGSAQMMKAVNDGTNGAPRTSSETRGTNYATKFVVWY
jgi:hypothetical protein